MSMPVPSGSCRSTRITSGARGRATHRVRNGPSLSDNLEGLVSINDLSNAASDNLVIVDDHDARTRSGIFTPRV